MHEYLLKLFLYKFQIFREVNLSRDETGDIQPQTYFRLGCGSHESIIFETSG